MVVTRVDSSGLMMWPSVGAGPPDKVQHSYSNRCTEYNLCMSEQNVHSFKHIHLFFLMYLELSCFLVHTFVLMRHCFVEHRTDLTISTHRTFWKLHFTWNYWKEKKTYMNQETGFCLYICFKWKSHLKIWLLAWLHHYCNNASWQ